MNYSKEIIKVAKYLKADSGDVEYFFNMQDYIDKKEKHIEIPKETQKQLNYLLEDTINKNREKIEKLIKDAYLNNSKVKKLLEDENNNIKAI